MIERMLQEIEDEVKQVSEIASDLLDDESCHAEVMNHYGYIDGLIAASEIIVNVSTSTGNNSAECEV